MSEPVSNDKIVRWLRGLAEAAVNAAGSRATFVSETYFEAADRIEALGNQLRAAIDRAWQPIDTAPKDVNVIIAVMAEGHETLVGEARFWSGAGDWWWGGTTPEDYFAGPISEINFGAPTHWMPLPPPPTTTGAAT